MSKTLAPSAYDGAEQKHSWGGQPGFAEEGLPQYQGHNGTSSEEDVLATLGYVPELVRSRSTAQVAFMSFVLSSVPYGLATTLIYPLTGGGPVTILWGWVAVCAIILCLSISLGEITSVYPTAGGVYYQTFMLSPPAYQRILAWICGWAFVLGNITITLSVNFGTTLLFVGCVNVFHDADGNGIFAAKAYQVYLIFLGITLLCNLISSLMNKWLPLLDTFAIGWTFLGVIAVIICTLAIAKNGRHSGEYVFTNFSPQSGWPPGWAFCVGLLHAAYATSASGMITSMCEEVQHPETQVPKAMVITIILNFICGFIFLIPLVFVLPEISVILADPFGQPLPVILSESIGNQLGAFLLCLPIMILGILCGVGCTTAASRATWAFARDEGMPGSRLWKQVNRKLDVPLNAMMLSMVVQLLLGLIYFGSVAAYNAFSGAGVIFLTLSYVMPVAVSFATKRQTISAGSFDMGTLGAFCNVVSIAWCLLAIPLFSMPSAIPVSSTTMNYASVVFTGGILISVLYYVAYGRRHYVGPPTEGGSTAAVTARRSSLVAADDRRRMKSGYSITFNFHPNPYFEDTKLTKTFTFLDDEGSMKITATSIKWKEGMGLPNGVNHEKKGNKRPFADESFFTWFSDTQEKDTIDGIHDEVAEIIKEDLWPNPLTYFNNEADEEEFEGEEGDEEGKEDDDSDDDEDDQEEDDDEDAEEEGN